MHDSLPIEIIEQFQRGNGLIFLGDRAVRDAQGQAIVDRLAADFARRLRLNTPAGFTLSQLAKLYEDHTSLNQVHLLVRERLQALTAPQPIHHHIAALHECNVIVATCLDRCLELAFAETGRPLHVTVSDTDVAFADGEAQLYKLRGTVEQPDSMLLTSSDYERFYDGRQAVSVVLQGELARKTVLFVGYDLGEEDFHRLYGKVVRPLDRYTRTAYTVFEQEPSPLVAVWCRKSNVKVIRAQPEAFLAELLQALSARRVAQPVAPSTPVEETQPLPIYPYKWLDYYTAADVGIFYGRESETAELINHIHCHRLVVLYGASGTGKTSLLQAGVQPRLERADPPYTVVSVRALDDPAATICQALRRKLTQSALPADGSLVDIVAAASRASGGTILIVLDQFEEFFIRLGPQLRQAFVEELATLYDAQDVAVKLVISLREDWLAALSEVEARIPDLFRVRQRLLPLNQEQAQQAITEPVAGLGMVYEPALVERLLADLGDGMASGVMPPQLQLVCDALYSAAVQDSTPTIGLASYAELDETSGILQRYLGQLLLEELVTAEGTKTVKAVDELSLALDNDSDFVGTMLEKLVRARLLRAWEQEGRQVYELAHEYLIQQIKLAPETLDRKRVQELLDREVETWRHFQTLLSEDRLALLHPWREQLRLNVDALDLLLRSSFVANHSGLVSWYNLALQAGVDVDVDAIALPERLEHDSFHERAKAVRDLVRFGDVYTESLVSMLADDYPQVRAAAIQGLDHLHPEEAWRAHLVHECYVPAGPFIMGDDKGKGSEKPVHTVHLTACYMGKYPVTNGEHARFMQDRGQAFRIPEGKEEHPVVNLSWHDARDYAAWAEMRLPTEAEWEKAARGTDGRIFPWGNEEPDDKRYNFNSKVGDITPVGIYPSGVSPYGCLDMAGNVWEWTSSLFKDYPYEASDGREGPDASGSRVLRGGSFYLSRYFVRCAFRSYNLIDDRSALSVFGLCPPASETLPL